MIQFLRGDKASLEASEYIPADGQPIYEKDTNLLKVGNGSSNYSALPYLGYSTGGMNWVEINGLHTPESTASIRSPDGVEPHGPMPAPISEFHLRYYIPSDSIGFIVDVGVQESAHAYLVAIEHPASRNSVYFAVCTDPLLQESSMGESLDVSYNSENRIIDITIWLNGVDNPQYILYLTDPTA